MDKLKQIRLATRTQDGMDYEPGTLTRTLGYWLFLFLGSLALIYLFCHGALKLDQSTLFTTYFSLNISSIDLFRKRLTALLHPPASTDTCSRQCTVNYNNLCEDILCTPWCSNLWPSVLHGFRFTDWARVFASSIRFVPSTFLHLMYIDFPALMFTTKSTS